MGVSMATERNGAGGCSERGWGGDGLRGMGDARAPLPGTATLHSCPRGGCWPDSAGDTPGRCLWGR